MRLLEAAELQEFRGEARSWLHENVPRDPRPESGSEMRAFDAEWIRCQYDAGWSGIDWPTQYGGRGLSLLEQVIWYEESARAGAPDDSCFTIAFGHAGPTLIAKGSEEQKKTYLPPILRGETPWCQGFSEPDAGSDIANVRTRAELDGDRLLVNGQKIWTSYAEHADFCELLVRTDPNAERHRGLSWLIVDLHSTGVEVRPIRQIDGRNEVCEVFFDNVEVPAANIVGELHGGWSVTLATLAIERGPGFLDWRLALIPVIDQLIDEARERRLLDGGIGDRLAALRAEATAVWSMAYLQISEAVQGGVPGPETTVIRTFFVEFQQRVARIAVEIMGADALRWNEWTRRWLTDFRMTIGGGTVDIQRNVIGERVLGLPR